MKFLCVRCDEQMSLIETVQETSGSLSVLFGCPGCSQRMCMLTNPSETQVVTSLGVKIGGDRSAGQEGSKCPFSKVVTGMESQGQTVDGKIGPDWSSEASARLENIPEFIRPMARKGIEDFARSRGYDQIDENVLDEARDQFGM